MYVVATDFAVLIRSENRLRWVNTAHPIDRYSGGQRFFFDEPNKTVTDKLENAAVYETKDATEAAAFMLVCLDPNLADHVHVMVKKLAEKEIEERKRRVLYPQSGLLSGRDPRRGSFAPDKGEDKEVDREHDQEEE